MVALTSIAITGVLGLAALAPPALSPLLFSAACAVIAFLTLVAWWNAARQEFAKSNVVATANELVRKLSHVNESPGIAVANFSSLSSSELRSRVHMIAQQMREMETEFRELRDRDLSRGRGNEDWDTFTSRLVTEGNKQTTRWRADLRPEAVALWDELRRRVYGSPPYPRDSGASTALEHGMLAGVSPLDNAATALERLARQLP